MGVGQQPSLSLALMMTLDIAFLICRLLQIKVYYGEEMNIYPVTVFRVFCHVNLIIYDSYAYCQFVSRDPIILLGF